MKKIKSTALFIVAFTAFAFLFTVGCAPASPAASEAQAAAASDTATSGNAASAEATPALLQLTLEELKQYDGQNGNPAYIAVDGVIYDVTNVPPWSGGTHNGFTAGQDLTDAIKTVSPHGVSKLSGVPVVGELVG